MNASGTVTLCQLDVPEVSVALSAATILQFFVCLQQLPVFFVRTGGHVRECAWMFAGGRVVGREMTPRPAQTVE